MIFHTKKSPQTALYSQLWGDELVEPRGIEPLSENPSSQLSPSAVCRLKFPRADPDKQASAVGSL